MSLVCDYKIAYHNISLAPRFVICSYFLFSLYVRPSISYKLLRGHIMWGDIPSQPLDLFGLRVLIISRIESLDSVKLETEVGTLIGK